MNVIFLEFDKLKIGWGLRTSMLQQWLGIYYAIVNNTDLFILNIKGHILNNLKTEWVPIGLLAAQKQRNSEYKIIHYIPINKYQTSVIWISYMIVTCKILYCNSKTVIYFVSVINNNIYN